MINNEINQGSASYWPKKTHYLETGPPQIFPFPIQTYFEALCIKTKL